MPTNVDDYLKTLPIERQRSIAERAVEGVAEELTLRELRSLSKLTQVEMAKLLGIKQDGVSRIENRPDMLVSTLRKAIAAMDGQLVIMATFTNRPSVHLGGIGMELRRAAKKKSSREAVTAQKKPGRKQVRAIGAH